MELIFLGTSAGVPTRSRNVTAILLDLQHPTRGGLWLFVCGEGTQHQLLHTPYHPGKLDKIFITHLHGDHLFGLPGLLCSRSMAGNANPLTIYGPAGIREFVDTTLRLSGSWTDYPLEVVEITAGLVLDDGVFEVTFIKRPKNLLELNETLTALLLAEIDERYMYSFRTNRLEVEAEGEVPWTLDGEYGGDHRAAVIEDRKQALEFIV